MDGLPILSITTFIPLIGALIILGFRILGGANVASSASKGIALLTSIVALVASLVALSGFDTAKTGYQFVESVPWFGGSSYKLGVDGMSIALIVLTTALTPLCVLQSATSIKDRLAEYMICFLVLEALMIGVFCALDLVLFYVFFEGGLIPMFLIIGVWGGKNKLYASFKFFLYTLLGSLLLLIALIYMGVTAGTTDVVPAERPASCDRGAAVSAGSADLAVAGLLRVLRCEAADVAGSYLVARCARRGADGGLGRAGGGAAEDGRLWFPSVLAADVPGSLAVVPAADVRAQRHRDRLCLAGRLPSD